MYNNLIINDAHLFFLFCMSFLFLSINDLNATYNLRTGFGEIDKTAVIRRKIKWQLKNKRQTKVARNNK